MPGRDRCVSRGDHQARLVGAFFVADRGQQFQRDLVVAHGLLRRADRHRLVAGPDAGGERGGQVVRFAGVAGQFGGGAVDSLVERRRVSGVDAHPFTRQQVVVDRLGQQGVPEAVSRVAPRFEDVRVDRLAQGSVEQFVGQIDDRGQQVVRHATSRDSGDADDAAPLLGEAVEAHQQQVGQLGRHHVLLRPLGRGGDQLFGEERVALGPVDDLAQVLLGERSGMQAVDELTHLVGVERRQVQALDARQPAPLGNRAAQRVAAMQVVAAVADHDRQPLIALPGEQEAQQVARGLVGPVDVLDDEQHRGRFRQPRQGTQHGFEQGSALDSVVGVGRWRADEPLRRHQSGDGRVFGE